MNLSISNIGWTEDYDDRMYGIMQEYGFVGLEIAPTRVFPEKPYDRYDEARAWKEKLFAGYGFSIPSMQSIWYGRPERVFGSDEERKALTEYTMKAVEFAECIGCGNLVFGCPRNRSIPDDGDMETAIQFFRVIGDYAHDHHTVIAMEANPPIYNTNFINTTEEALNLIDRVNSEGFMLNLDVGTMIENGEKAEVLIGREHMINHVHISEPGLKPIQKRALHRELAVMLQDMNYQGFVSIEAGRQDNIGSLADMMQYVKEIFG